MLVLHIGTKRVRFSQKTIQIFSKNTSKMRNENPEFLCLDENCNKFSSGNVRMMLIIYFLDSTLHISSVFEQSVNRRKLTRCQRTCVLPGREVGLK